MNIKNKIKKTLFQYGVPVNYVLDGKNVKIKKDGKNVIVHNGDYKIKLNPYLCETLFQ